MPSDALDYISYPARQRVASCGAPMRLLRDSGDCESIRYRCEHRFCDWCARRYSGRVATAIRETIEAADDVDDSGPYMLTLTHRHRQEQSTERQRLRSAWDRIRRHWRRASTRASKYVRWRDRYPKHKRRANDPTCERQALFEHFRQLTKDNLEEEGLDRYHSRRPDLDYDRTWDDGGAWPGYDLPDSREGDRLSYLWAREVTRGEASGGGEHDRAWHVHMHILCLDRETAEILNAAWQDTRTQSDVCRTDIRAASTALEAAEADVDDAAEYLSLYVTGTRSGAFMADDCGDCEGCESGGRCEDPEPWEDRVRRAYVEGLQGKTLYGAAGQLRPIGVGDRPSSDDPAIAVAWGDLDIWETWREFWGEGSTVRSAMQIGSGLHGWPSLPAEIRGERPEMAIDCVGEAIRRDVGAQGANADMLEQDRNNSEHPPGGWHRVEWSSLDTLSSVQMKGGRRDRLVDRMRAKAAGRCDPYGRGWLEVRRRVDDMDACPSKVEAGPIGSAVLCRTMSDVSAREDARCWT